MLICEELIVELKVSDCDDQFPIDCMSLLHASPSATRQQQQQQQQKRARDDVKIISNDTSCCMQHNEERENAVECFLSFMQH